MHRRREASSPVTKALRAYGLEKRTQLLHLRDPPPLTECVQEQRDAHARRAPRDAILVYQR